MVATGLVNRFNSAAVNSTRKISISPIGTSILPI